jgi:hypothetical protein
MSEAGFLGKGGAMQQPKTLRFSARSLQGTAVIDPAPLVGLIVPGGVGQVSFQIEIGGRKVRGGLSARSVRRAVLAIGETPENFNAVIKGKLSGDEFYEAGLQVVEKKRPARAAEVAAIAAK